MNVTINGVTYNDAEWSTDSMIFETEMTLAEIEAAFTPGENSTIVVTDGDMEVARYYNKALNAVTVTGAEPRKVTIQFDITQITPNAETEIRSDIEDSDGAIVELAEIVADLSSLDLDNMAAELQSHQETINTWFSNASELGQFINDLRKSGGILDMFDARITALEHEVGIVSVQMNDEEAE